ncbi:hypothetical protein MAR_000203 [Mya arenaria]|uniref:Uncharacterized protein n=1 Tax=Mya arenaria TaxID=6604 RepID=A0ABY7F835_MYAAR|nr:hypothetical protein MAR_000203 [Mya arenaria]
MKSPSELWIGIDELQCEFRDICVVLGHPHLELLLRDALGHPHLDLLLRDVLGHPHLDLLLPDALGHPHLDLLLRDALGHPALELLIPDSMVICTWACYTGIECVTVDRCGVPEFLLVRHKEPLSVNRVLTTVRDASPRCGRLAVPMRIYPRYSPSQYNVIIRHQVTSSQLVEKDRFTNSAAIAPVNTTVFACKTDN